MTKWQWLTIIVGGILASIGALTEAVAQSSITADGMHITTATLFAWPVVVALLTTTAGAVAVATNLKNIDKRLAIAEQLALDALPRSECRESHRERTRELREMKDEIIERVREMNSALAASYRATEAGHRPPTE